MGFLDFLFYLMFLKTINFVENFFFERNFNIIIFFILVYLTMIIDKFLTSLPNDLSYSFRIRKNIKVKIMFKNKNNLKKSNRINKNKNV